jgi:hypothetical protein
VDVDLGEHRRVLVRRQQPVDQRLQAVGLVDDDVGVLGAAHKPARGRLHGQQLRRAADAAQRVLDLVRQVAQQLLLLARQPVRALLAVLARLLFDLDHLQQHAGARAAALQRADDDVHRHLARARRGAAQRGLEAADDHLARALQRVVQRRRIDEPVGRLALHQLAARLAQGVFQRRVDRLAAAIGAHQRHHGGQQVEGLGAGRVERGAHGAVASTGRRIL